METRIPNFAPANNVGQVEVSKQYNNIAPNAKALDMSVDNNQQGNHIVNVISPLAPWSRLPEHWRDDAIFAQRSSTFPGNYNWSVLAGDFASAEEHARLTAEIQRRWQQSEQSVKRLNRAALAFQSSRHRSESEGSDGSDDSDDILLPEIVTKEVFRAELEQAICFYNQGPWKQSPVLRSLRAISADMDALLSWLAWLRDKRHRSSVFCMSTPDPNVALKNFIEVTRDKDKPLDEVMEKVAATVCSFSCGLEDYLSAMRTNRLTAAMEVHTVEIFESMVAIFVPLLKRGRKKLRSSQRQTIEDSIRGLGDALSSAKNAVKGEQTQPLPNNGVPQQHEPGAYLRHLYHFLRSNVGSGPIAHPVAGEPRLTRRFSMSERDAGPIPAKTLIRCLGYRAANTTAEIDQCLSLARPGPGDELELDAFTRGTTYRSWLKEESKHSALLVRGGFTMPQQRRIFSPLSYLCADIAHHYANEDKVVVLSYFCDLHEPSGNRSKNKRKKKNNKAATEGPAHLMSQLIGQLLSHPAVAQAYARDPIFDHHWKRKIEARDAKTLIKAFSALIRQLRACELVVFCLIDAIAKLETRPTRRGVREGTAKALSELRDLVQERKGSHKRKADDRMVFKLLVSTGAMRVEAERFFDENDIVDLISSEYGF